MEAEKDKKTPDGSKHITLKVLGQDGNELFFRMRRNAKLWNLMHAYCDRVSADIRTFQFLFDGGCLRGEQTPEEVGLENDDEIDAMVHMTGAGGKS